MNIIKKGDKVKLVIPHENLVDIKSYLITESARGKFKITEPFEDMIFDVVNSEYESGDEEYLIDISYNGHFLSCWWNKRFTLHVPIIDLDQDDDDCV